MTKKELVKTSELVKGILEQDERARNSDEFLYLRVLGVLGEMKGIDIFEMSVPCFLLNRKEMNFPCFETVRRSRQKVQADFPELASVERVGKKRKENEQVYKAFALSGKGASNGISRLEN